MTTEQRLFATFLRRSVWAYFWGSLAVLFNALIVHGLYFAWEPWAWLYAAGLGVLVSLPMAAADLWLARRQLAPAHRLFAEGGGGLEAARAAYHALSLWPLLSAGRVMGPHLLTILAAFFPLVYLAHRYGGFPTGPGEMLYLLPWYPLNAALHATVEYLVGAAESQRLLAHLRARHGDAVVAWSRLRVPFLVKVLGVMVALGLLPLGQVALLAYFKLQGYGTAPDPAALPALIAWGLASGLALVLAGGVLLSREVARPVGAVLEAMRQVRAGQAGVRVSAIAWDELGDLTEGFNALSQALEVERQRNQDLYRDTVQALSAAIDARDPYTRGHSQRVGAYARLIARKLGWTPQQAYQLYITGLLHDIGKIGVPEHVLNKAGKLDPDERELVEGHTLIGYNIARQARALEPHLPGIRHHHERMDGKGYPDGLSGEAIGAEARILAVADVWDALTSRRPYRRALTPQEAYRQLQLESLDPRAVRALWELWQEGALEELLEDARQHNPALGLGGLSAPPPQPGSAPARPDEGAPGFRDS